MLANPHLPGLQAVMSRGRQAGRRCLARALVLGLAGLGACAGYEPAKPGLHYAPGEQRTDIRCSYETPTASRFMGMRCQRLEDAQQGE